MRARPIFRTGAIEKNRLEAFSDGVIAIVITLLVLELKVPAGIADETGLRHALAHLAPAVAAWVISFLFVLVFWVNHHYFIASLRQADRGLLWLNGLFLLCISATPFPTGLVGEYPGMTLPLVILSLSMAVTSLAFAAMRLYVGVNRSLAEHEPPTGQARKASLWTSAAVRDRRVRRRAAGGPRARLQTIRSQGRG
ncbi:TMEM175 family protein [Erythrobacter sp. NE805]|uniref:TMEM175 family protein n=1 Tax=Erythrobacter sp. NE805 TaxID=3389875 RepID=UPI00396B38B0